MSANKYLQKILEIHGLDIKTIGGRSENNNREHDSIKGGIFGFNRKSKVAPLDISCNDTEYMGKIQESLLEMKKKMKTKGLKDVIIPSNGVVIFVSITKSLRIKMSDNYVKDLESLFSEFMENENIDDETETIKKIVTFLNVYFNNCKHVFYYIDNLIDATLKGLIMTKPNIKQLKNGINPSYGGGFILFDSEFNPQNIIHTNYSDATNIVMNNMVITKYNSNDSNDLFKSGQKLDIKDILKNIKLILKVDVPNKYTTTTAEDSNIHQSIISKEEHVDTQQRMNGHVKESLSDVIDKSSGKATTLAKSETYNLTSVPTAETLHKSIAQKDTANNVVASVMKHSVNSATEKLTALDNSVIPSKNNFKSIVPSTI